MFKRIGIIAKHTLATSKPEYVKKLVQLLKGYKVDIVLDETIAPLFKRTGYEKAGVISRSDLVIVLGGDGTLLKTARSLNKKPPIIVGVNMGNLGFLTGFSPDGLIKALPDIFAEKYEMDERFVLRVTLYRNGKKSHTSLALNEAVINQGGFARLINLKVEVDQRELCTYRADGLIIATPTGSTGHSLSAGGPIVHPKIPSLLLAPICPVRLTLRPIIIPHDRKVTIRLETEWRAEKKPIVLTIDGQLTFNLKRGDVIRIRESSRRFRMIRMPGHNYYRMLREKLSWGT
ncbi:NAD(+)/NADH kinase [Candidatus Gracilibacteria bacterium]|nr:NAD(+)/NADH kinase [Candidatus Gracilibacteria bacterium]